MSQEHIHYGKVIVEKDFHEIQENLVQAKILCVAHLFFKY